MRFSALKNFLVTGGAGFIGSNFVHYLLRNLPLVNVITLDSLTYAGNLANLASLQNEKRHLFIQGDICDRPLLKHLFRDHPIDAVVHFAAETHVDRSILAPDIFVETNVVGTHRLLDAALEHWTERGDAPFRFLHISTDEVYGELGHDEPAFTENTCYAPRSPYAASKAAADHLAKAYWHTYKLPVIVTNCSNNYGPLQHPEKLIPLMVANAVKGKPLPIYGDGQQIRDWLYVEDHCGALNLILQRGTPGETYAIGGSIQIANLELVQLLCREIDKLLPNSGFSPHEKLIQFVEDRAGHDRRYAIDAKKITRELGWKPSVDLQKGLEKTIRWYLDNQEWAAEVTRRESYSQWIAQNYGSRYKS